MSTCGRVRARRVGYAPAVRRRSHPVPFGAIRGIRSAIVVGMAAVIAACGGDDSGRDSTTTYAGSASTTVSVAPAAPSTTPGAGTTSTSGGPGSTSSTTDARAQDGHPEVRLRSDGLGVTAFGDMPEYTIAALRAELGRPSRDVTEPAFSSFGTCPGTSLRAVEWGGPAVLITDGATAYGIEDGPHFFAYSYRADESLGLVTQEGIGLGSTVGDLRAAFGAGVRVNPEQDLLGASFEVGPYGPGGLYGLLDGTADTNTVTQVAAGQPCGE